MKLFACIGIFVLLLIPVAMVVSDSLGRWRRKRRCLHCARVGTIPVLDKAGNISYRLCEHHSKNSTTELFTLPSYEADADGGKFTPVGFEMDVDQLRRDWQRLMTGPSKPPTINTTGGAAENVKCVAILQKRK